MTLALVRRHEQVELQIDEDASRVVQHAILRCHGKLIIEANQLRRVDLTHQLFEHSLLLALVVVHRLHRGEDLLQSVAEAFQLAAADKSLELFISRLELLYGVHQLQADRKVALDLARLDAELLLEFDKL